MKYQVDIKSILIGFLSAALLIGIFSFKDQSSEKEGRYQTAVGEKGVVILDTKTGAYIVNTYLTDRDWRKGDFSNPHQLSKSGKIN